MGRGPAGLASSCDRGRAQCARLAAGKSRPKTVARVTWARTTGTLKETVLSAHALSAMAVAGSGGTGTGSRSWLSRQQTFAL